MSVGDAIPGPVKALTTPEVVIRPIVLPLRNQRAPSGPAMMGPADPVMLVTVPDCELLFPIVTRCTIVCGPVWTCVMYVYQTAPSGPTVTPQITPTAAGVWKDRTGEPLVSISTIWKFGEVGLTLITSNVSPGPATMLLGAVREEFVKSVTAPEVEIRPIEPSLRNQRAPSDPATIPSGSPLVSMFALPIPKLVTSPMLTADADWAAANGPTMVPHTRRGKTARAIIDRRKRRAFGFTNLGSTIQLRSSSRVSDTSPSPLPPANQRCNIFGHCHEIAVAP
jgi:hypothetical protein